MEWGCCSGVLGHASDKNEHVPRALAWRPSLEAGETLRISAGLYHCAAFTQRRAWLWGRGSGGRLGQVLSPSPPSARVWPPVLLLHLTRSATFE